MKCLKCGYCCINYMVVIVDDPKKGLCEDNLIGHLGKGKPCKHLIGNTPGKYSCAIHDYEWYKETPCYKHTQIEDSSDCVCRIGQYQINNYSKK